MRAAIRYQGATGPVAPFSLVLLLCVILADAVTVASAGPLACPATRTDERVRVGYVFDGDTVRLSDGRRVRLIGINTPELDHDGAHHDAFAETARTALQELLDTANQSLLLQYGAQQRDHYGRLLAHAFLPDGSNVGAHMLERGLATALVVPPNSWGRNCYRKLEDEARIDRRGLWSLPHYQVLDSRALATDMRGFRIVSGTVSAVRHSGKSTWVELPGSLVLRIGSKDRANFADGYLEALVGRGVETRGWLKAHGDGLMMNIRHPAALTVLESAAL